MLLVRMKEAPADARLTAVFRAAQRTDFYRHWLRSLDDEPSHTLDLLPQVDIAHFDADPQRFHNPRSLRSRAAEFLYPFQPAPRVFVLAEGFRRSANVEVIKKFDTGETPWRKGETIAAPLAMLRKLAGAKCSFEFPIVAFTGVRHGYLTPEDRELFWESFGVPVFEQLTGLGNDVVAEECEAHEGLHIRSNDAIFEFRSKELIVSSLRNLSYPVLRLKLGLTGRIEQGLCSCGKPGPRLVELAVRERALRAAAG